MTITVALAQMAIAAGQPHRNGDMVRTLVGQAASEGAHLVVLPELWPTGYVLDTAVAGAAPLGEGPFALMAGLALRYRLYLVGTALEENPGGLPFNTAALYGPDGKLAAAYRKVHLFPPMGERERMAPGAALPVFDLPWGRTALAICYDLRFPELWRRYMDLGAEIILISAEWPVPRVEHWRLLLRARAVENQFFVVGCNRAGTDADGEFGGYSAAVDPWGKVLAEGGAGPGLFLATVNLEDVGRCRQMFPWLQDRRPEVCGHV